MNRSSISGIVKQVPAQIKKKTITQDVMNYINNQSEGQSQILCNRQKRCK